MREERTGPDTNPYLAALENTLYLLGVEGGGGGSGAPSQYQSLAVKTKSHGGRVFLKYK